MGLLEQQISDHEQNILNKETSDDDLDAILEELEHDDSIMDAYREQRAQELTDHFKKVDKNVTEENYGQLQTIDLESDVIEQTAKAERSVILFELPQFPKCQYMKEKLALLSARHLTTKFMTVNVGNCPFLTHKLKIKVLPFVVAYKKGVERLRITGFDKLGATATAFPLDNLEKLLYQNDAIEKMRGISAQTSIPHS